MLAVFTKPLELVTSADVAELSAQTWPEGYEVEFKKTLPYRSGGSHPWLAGSGSIGDYARDEILGEVIAFANAQGGSVVLGIEETSDKPPRAHAVVAVPRVGELARRFEDQARSCIDPPLPRLQIRAIETDAQGGGVVVFRVSPSRAAPHRLTTNRESFVRHGSSTMKMTMREIQDMTLNVARGLARIDASFDERRSAFHKWANPQADVVACRVTALPLVDLPDPGRLFGKPGAFPAERDFKATANHQSYDLWLGLGRTNERPRLRGIERSNQTDQGAFQWELHQNGLTDLWIAFRPRQNSLAAANAPAEHLLRHQNVLAAVANGLCILDHHRTQVGAPEAEYGMEIEIISTGNPPIIYTGVFVNDGTYSWPIPSWPIILPRYSVGVRDEFAALLEIVNVDMYDALGIRQAQPPSLRVEI
jgi:hypothetical protein